jgi:cytochrome c oxidase subunit 2
MRRSRRHLVVVAGLVVLVSLITYPLLTLLFPLPIAASAQAGPIDRMINVHFILISILFSLIVVFMLYSIVVFRRKGDDMEDAVHFHGHTGLEITWTIVPLIIVISLGVWAAFVLSEITAESAGDMNIRVTGRQWSWVFSYPDFEELGPQTELILPVNRSIRLEMTTDDVLHDFWVPEFRVKQDLVPGQVTILLITPTEIGDYTVRCAEICGFDHANMRASVSVISEADFANWVADQSVSITDLSDIERGEKWASDYGCVSCHSVDGSSSVGPTWLGIYGSEESLEDGSTVTVDDVYLRESIFDPGKNIVAGFQNLMPATFTAQFASAEAEILANSDLELDIAADLIAYIKSLATS